MRERLFIQYEGEEPVQCQVVDGSGKPAAGIYRGGLQDMAHFTQGRQVVVIVPAKDMLCYRPVVPKTSLARLRQAVPYLLEDNLLGPLDEYHFALGQRDSGGHLPVTIFPFAMLQSWLSPFDAASIRPGVMVPDTLCLPLAEAQWSLYVDESGVRVRTSQYEGFFAEWENVELLMASLLADSKAVPERYVVYGEDIASYTDQLSVLKQQLASDDPESWQELSADLFQLCHENYATLPPLNLLQGSLKPKAQFDRQLGRWRLAAGLLLGLLLLQLFSYTLSYWQLSRELGWLDEQIEMEIHNGFPEIKTIRQPLNQVNAALRQLRAQAGESQYHRLISAIGLASQAQNVNLQELNYRNQRMTISLQLPDLQSVNSYEQALAKQSGIEVKVLSAKKKDKLVSARLEISGGRK
ncbi:MAG: type II secretion system protein GspL [Gammaproteobacteria bacterium]|nr:type II secretion system protein GspL [Gammaproteobacteria bacterium]